MRFTPAEYKAGDDELCNAEGCGEYPDTICDMCSMPCCTIHSKIIVDGPVRDRVCFDCLDSLRAMEAGK